MMVVVPENEKQHESNITRSGAFCDTTLPKLENADGTKPNRDKETMSENQETEFRYEL
jgi:hypothetical protein